MMSGEEKTKCRVCNKLPAETKEHLPPQSTQNRGNVHIRFIKGDNSKGIEHKSVKLQNGFWMRVLCKKYNPRLGTIYGSNYSDFFNQFTAASLLFDLEGKHQIFLREIYPLRIIKQIFAMFLCIFPSAPPEDWESLRKFVQKKEELLPEDAPYVYLYKNDSPNSRIVPWRALAEVFTPRKPILIAEISWAPVGIVFCHERDDRFEFMENITHWGKMSYKRKVNLQLSLPALKITCDHPVAFGTPNEVERWRTRNGVIWVVPETEYKDLETNTSLILKRGSQ